MAKALTLLRSLPFLSVVLLIGAACQPSADPVDAGTHFPSEAGSSSDAAVRLDTPSANDAGPDRLLSLAHQDHQAIDDYLEQQMQRLHLVGMAAAVVEGRTIRYLKAFGFEDRENEIAADPKQTVWRLASLSKGVTGVIATRLAQRGLIDLDAPLPNLEPQFITPGRFLPLNCNEHACSRRLPDDAAPITLDLLLHHRAGIVHYSNGVGDPSPPQNLADDASTNLGIRWGLTYLSGQPLTVTPGTRFDYSSFGYNLLGAALEERTEQTFDALLESEVAAPAEAPSLQVERIWNRAPRAAMTYVQWGDNMRPDDPHDISWKAPGGGLVATVEDMARYCGALLHRRLTGEARDQMLWATAPDELYAHGFVRDPESNAMHHSGAQQGARTGILVLPESMRCFIAVTNSEAGNGTHWTEAMAARWDD